MRILWVCNIMLPAIAEQLGLSSSNKEGWLTGISNEILLHYDENKITLGVAFPVGKDRDGCKGEVTVQRQKLSYYGFYEDTEHPEIYEEATEHSLNRIIKDFQPDVIHCFGTEYGHTLAVSRVCEDKKRVLVSIQGLCSVYANAYMANLPEKVCRRVTLRDFLRQDSLMQQQEKFVKRGEREIEAIRNVGNVTGRTDWDEYYTKKWNPHVRYFAMNETLRSLFYEGQWSEKDCEPHTIFLSQGDYPIKGLHYMLLALPEISRSYPDVKVKVAGNSLVRSGGLTDRMKLSSYGKYLRDIIKEKGLEERVAFLGRLDAAQMKEQYLKAGLYVCCSTIENSPNSLGEAMLLGVPCVSADVGGIPSLFCHGEDGILYSGFKTNNNSYDNVRDEMLSEKQKLENNVKMLSKAVEEMWKSREQKLNYSSNARNHARKTHNKLENYKKMMEIYAEIGRNKEGENAGIPKQGAENSKIGNVRSHGNR